MKLMWAASCAVFLTSCQVNIPPPKSAPKPVEKVKVHRATAVANRATSETVSVTLVWNANPEPDIAGYKIHSGPMSHAYDQIKDVGNVTQATVDNLPLGTNYFALSAYNQNGFESALSNEASSTQQATPTPTPVPSATPSASPTATFTPTATATSTPAATATASATTAPSPTTTPGRLVNISTRAFVQTGNNVLIAGFIIKDRPTRIIARALGPSLASSFPLTLSNPFLELRDSTNALLDENDDWRSDQEQEIIATGIPPTNDRESAIVRTLPPGNYTVIVHGVNDGTGVALAEVYALGP